MWEILRDHRQISHAVIKVSPNIPKEIVCVKNATNLHARATRKTFASCWQVGKFVVQKESEFFVDEKENLIHRSEKLLESIFLEQESLAKLYGGRKEASEEEEGTIKSLLMEDNKHLTNWVPGRHKVRRTVIKVDNGKVEKVREQTTCIKSFSFHFVTMNKLSIFSHPYLLVITRNKADEQQLEAQR